MTNTLVSLVIAILVLWLIIAFLIPLLPHPFNTIALVLVVIFAIIWLARTFAPSLKI